LNIVSNNIPQSSIVNEGILKMNKNNTLGITKSVKTMQGKVIQKWCMHFRYNTPR